MGWPTDDPDINEIIGSISSLSDTVEEVGDDLDAELTLQTEALVDIAASLRILIAAQGFADSAAIRSALRSELRDRTAARRSPAPRPTPSGERPKLVFRPFGIFGK